MKRHLTTLKIFASIALNILAFSPASAQPRNSGKLVVPIGYETLDSVLFRIFGLEEYRSCGPTASLVNAYADSVYATSEGWFGDIYPGSVVGGKRKGITTYNVNLDPHGTDIVDQYKARTFYPYPSNVAAFGTGNGEYWRYNDIMFNPAAKFYDNTYDANDISPYCEYPMNDSFVHVEYVTGTYSGPDTVFTGNNGRVILGYSDDHFASDLLWTFKDNVFMNGAQKAFSVNLDFNVADAIDTALAAGRSVNNLPLVTLQVLFKKGQDSTAGWPVLPFTPFRDATHTTGTLGWYKVAEVVVTDSLYHTLEYSWKSEDTLQSGLPSHPGWRFRQLHVLLNNLPASMDSLINPTTNGSQWANWGQGSGNALFTTFANPDQVVALDTSTVPGISAAAPLIEIRVLSTYRDTVRVRGLDYHDTLMDKFLYRRITDTITFASHSCNPDGSVGGYDDTVRAFMADTSSGHHNLPRDFFLNDTQAQSEEGSSGTLSVPILGYMDFIGSSYNVHGYWRPGDYEGKDALHFRRFRMIYDGKPPSLFENQLSYFGPGVVFPSDYTYYNNLDPRTTAYPSSDDTVAGLAIGRIDTSASIKAYRDYYNNTIDPSHSIASWCSQLRASSSVALWHPNNKRFAVEASLQGWGALAYSWTTDSAGRHYNKKIGYNAPNLYQRPTNPEETLVQGYCYLAEGISAFNNAQAIDLPLGTGGDPGIYGVAMRTLSTIDTIRLTHSYNIGHQYTPWTRYTVVMGDTTWIWSKPDTSDISGNMPPFYLGYSNTWRAENLLLTRINAIYDSTNGRNCPHPFKYLTWQNAYSNSMTGSNTASGDSVTKANAFLKIDTTFMVKRYSRGPGNSFIDSTAYDALVSNRQVEVGLFKDSISSTNINHAAILVNTRLWPSLVDTADMNYYNQGLDSLSMCHTTLGDIDTRKVFMTIDTTQFESSFRTKYYVVRDLWHPDTCWLVCADSNFAVYLKPGDAKFLYFEKAIAIDAAPTATVNGTGFTSNSGHSVAELMNGTKQVIAYIRDEKLYVSCPAEGQTFGGYNEHSASDNLATGPEGYFQSPGNFVIGALDTSLCATPSVSPGRNDTSVAIAYATIISGLYYIRVAYRPHPDSGWKFLTDTAVSFTGGSPYPVITPLGPNEWSVVGAKNPVHPTDSSWLVQFRFKSLPGSALTLEDTVPVSLGAYPYDPVNGITGQTITSRPNLMYGYPGRMAWGYKNQIWYRQYGFDSLNHLHLTPIENVSGGLPNCGNMDPCIATVGFWVSYNILFFSITKYYEADYVTWDAVGFASGPIDLTPYQYVPAISARRALSGWSPYILFRPDSKTGTHNPVIGTRSMNDFDEFIFSHDTLVEAAKDSDLIRDVWSNVTSHNLEVSSFGKHVWSKNQLAEHGSHPSIPMRIDSLPSDSELFVFPYRVYDHLVTSLNSIVFQGMPDGGHVHVRTTNANLPWITNKLTADAGVLFFGASSVSCGDIRTGLHHQNVIVTGTGTPTKAEWVPTNPGSDTAVTGAFPYPPTTAEIHSTGFAYHPNDSISIARQVSIGDTASIRAVFHSPLDYIKYRLLLLKASDSSTIAVLDSFMIVPVTALNPTGLLAPGYLHDSLWLGYKIGGSVSADSGFLSIETSRFVTTDSVSRAIIYYMSDSTTARGAAKTAAPNQVAAPSAFTIAVHPNPFHSTTLVELQTRGGSHTVVELYDILGNRLQTLFDADSPQSGYIPIALNVGQLPSGSYLIRATNGNAVLTRRIEMLK